MLLNQLTLNTEPGQPQVFRHLRARQMKNTANSRVLQMISIPTTLTIILTLESITFATSIQNHFAINATYSLLPHKARVSPICFNSMNITRGSSLGFVISSPHPPDISYLDSFHSTIQKLIYLKLYSTVKKEKYYFSLYH